VPIGGAARSLNFKFSRSYNDGQAVQQISGCCYSNTNAAEVLLEKQFAIARFKGPHA
jgi:hypothetical protein